MSANDGGSAFPLYGHDRFESSFGMSLRDRFAGQAMQGIVSSIDSEANYQRLRELAARDGLTVSQWIARDSYKQADAMLAARSEGRKDGAR